MATTRKRRFIAGLILVAVAGLLILLHPGNYQSELGDQPAGSATQALNELSVKGRAPKTGYQRSQFGSGWTSIGACDVRNQILHRDMTSVTVDDQCHVLSGQLDDPYTGKVIQFLRGPETSQSVQVDHVVALSDAWQKGAQQLSFQRRIELANDPLNLLAVDGKANNDKADSDAASWLPPNKSFRCQYVARQIAVKRQYSLWVTVAEKSAMAGVLKACPAQALPVADTKNSL